MAPPVLLVALALILPVVPTPHEQDPSTACAPPCGEINPRLLFSFPDVGRDAFPLEAGASRSFDGTVTYWFDADDEGYTPPDPQTPIEVSFSFPKLPPWATMTIEPAGITVDTTCATCWNASADDPAVPQLHFEQRTPVVVTLEITGEPVPTPGYEYGKLQLFAKSTESGIYNPGYGIREFRVAADEPSEGFSIPGAGPLALLAVLAVAAAASTAWRVRKR